MNIQPVKTPKITITKKGFVKMSRILTIICVFILYVLSDYVTSKSNGGFITDVNYWSLTLINLVLVISIMITVRQMRKDKIISESFEIQDTLGQIERGFKKITINGFSSKLDLYLDKLNEQSKYETFIRKIQSELLKCSEKEKYTERRKFLNSQLQLSKEEVLKLNFKYKKITVTKLFSSVDGKIVNDNEFDLDTYEKQDIAKMVGLKALLVILFTAFTGTIVFNFFISGLSAIYGSIIKLFSLCLAVNTALNVADEFVEHNVKCSLQKRLKHLTGFVNENLDLKELLKSEKQDQFTSKPTKE